MAVSPNSSTISPHHSNSYETSSTLSFDWTPRIEPPRGFRDLNHCSSTIQSPSNTRPHRPDQTPLDPSDGSIENPSEPLKTKEKFKPPKWWQWTQVHYKPIWNAVLFGGALAALISTGYSLHGHVNSNARSGPSLVTVSGTVSVRIVDLPKMTLEPLGRETEQLQHWKRDVVVDGLSYDCVVDSIRDMRCRPHY
jgi:hypothetical protein